MHLMGGMGLTSWLAVAVDLPVVVYQGFDRTTPDVDVPNTPSSYGLSDARLIAKARIIDNQRGGFGMAFVPQFTFPSGNGKELRGDEAYGIEPRLALDYRTKQGAFLA